MSKTMALTALLCAALCSCSEQKSKKNEASSLTTDSAYENTGIGDEKTMRENFSWLAGEWVGKNSGGTFTEKWTLTDHPEGTGFLIADTDSSFPGDKKLNLAAYSIKKGDTIFKEKLAILKSADRYGLRVQVDDSEAIWFALTDTRGDSLTFRNNSNQPQLIIYKKISNDEILAYTQSNFDQPVLINGEFRTEEKDVFHLKRKK